MKLEITTKAPAFKYFFYEIEASSIAEAKSKILRGEVEPYESHYELTGDEEIAYVEVPNMADGGMMAKGGMTVGSERVGSRIMYFIYNSETGKKSRYYQSKEDAEKELNDMLQMKYALSLGKHKMADGGMMAKGGYVEYYKNGELKNRNRFFENKYSVRTRKNILGFMKDNDFDYAKIYQEGKEVIAIKTKKDGEKMGWIEGNEPLPKFADEMADGGMMANKGGMSPQKRAANTGLSWHQDHARHNKSQDYEVPVNNRKRRRL